MKNDERLKRWVQLKVIRAINYKGALAFTYQEKANVTVQSLEIVHINESLTEED